MRRWVSAIGVVLFGTGVVLGQRLPRAPVASDARDAPVATKQAEARVVHDLVATPELHVDLYVPAPSAKPTPWMVFAHERGWPAPDEKERASAAIADAMQRRGIAVAVVSFTPTDARPLRQQAESVAATARDLARRAGEYHLAAEPVLAGDELGASVVAMIALDPHFGLEPSKLRGVVAINGVYGDEATAHARADAPPFLVLSAHDDTLASAHSSRALARSLERAGAKRVHGYYASTRDARSLTNLSGEKNEVGDVVAAFVRGETEVPGGTESAWALSDMWGRNAPLTSEPFWKDERLVVRKPTDARFRAAVRNVFGEMMRDLEPWPALTYDAIDLGAYLHAHPELGRGDWVEVTNARGEKLVLSRTEIDRKKPVIVVGIDEERNLFRLFVTYNVHRTYSWKPDAEPRPLLVRHVGAFLHVPGDAAEGLHVVTLADFALTTSSFRVTDKDPLAGARAMTKPVAATLTNEQGCLQCHALRGEGARAHHLRASDGKIAEAHGLALEEYPRDVLSRFLFEQDAVAKSFGVSPLHVAEPTAKLLFAEVAR